MVRNSVSSGNRRSRRHPNPYPGLADLIKTKRHSLGKTIGETAREGDFDKSNLSRWEQGKSIPSGPQLIRLAAVLRLHHTELEAVCRKSA